MNHLMITPQHWTNLKKIQLDYLRVRNVPPEDCTKLICEQERKLLSKTIVLITCSLCCMQVANDHKDIICNCFTSQKICSTCWEISGKRCTLCGFGETPPKACNRTIVRLLPCGLQMLNEEVEVHETTCLPCLQACVSQKTAEIGRLKAKVRSHERVIHFQQQQIFGLTQTKKRSVELLRIYSSQNLKKFKC